MSASSAFSRFLEVHMRRCVWILSFLLLSSTAAHAQVLRLAEMNTAQIRALDRSKTVVFLTGGMIEEHGPYLPAFTDGILSERLTAELLKAFSDKKPGWTALVLPAIGIGASGYNEFGGHYVFPGTYAIRPSTLRALFMDLAEDLGEQGFRRIFVVHVHGSPHHIGALDDAGDYFSDTYGGQMVNLWGLLPVIGGWGRAVAGLTDAIKQEEGASFHAGMDEHSLMLHLRPDLVEPGYKSAPIVTGATAQASLEIARRPDWPGYLGSPRLASADVGQRIWTSFATAAVAHMIKILDGTDPRRLPRYGDLMRKNPVFQEWIKTGETRDAERQARQQAWLAKRRH
jgi:creatinine amidohydrolase/Fe(II)-dependent formamide hydrolase-like protein